MRRLLLDPFLILLMLAVVLATLLPARGDVAAGIGVVATAAIVFLFFVHGVRMPRDALVAAVSHWRLHGTILGCTYLLFPVLGIALHAAAPSLLSATLWSGVLFLCALSSTVQTSIALTASGRGNVGGSIAAAAASNMLGIALTPLLVGLMAQAQGAAISFSGIWKIVLQLLLPFTAGHLLRPWLADWAARQKHILTHTDRATIVLAIYTAFSAAAQAGTWRQVPAGQLLLLTGLCALLLALVLLATRTFARAAGFSREDEVAIVMCGAQKSLVSGIPMARVLFAGPVVGVALLPVMIYHQMQLVACAVLARRYGERPGGPAED